MLSKTSTFLNHPNLIIRRFAIQTANSDEVRQRLKDEVKNLYRTLLYLSREWPTDIRPKIREAFKKNIRVTSEDEIRRLIDRGNYICREITATYHLRKYRAMKRRYYSDD